ncbi:MAG: hypothetical protein Q7U75_19300, partial [Desulfobacterales bacterium]|nr:hypothetical protein [Desulfobacterales bacterium]
MRNRNLILLLTVLFAVLAAGCASKGPISKGNSDQINAIQGKISKAIGQDAKACAPKELAYAEADLDQARLEATESWENTKGYLDKADKSTGALLKKVQDCEDAKKVPGCGLVADPDTVAPGKCATLKWKGENVKQILFGSDDKEAKSPELPMTGTKEVCPKETTDSQFSCVGKFSTNYEFVTVKVEEPAPPPPPAPAPAPAPEPAPAPAPPPAPPKVMEKVDLHINFDSGKSVI